MALQFDEIVFAEEVEPPFEFLFRFFFGFVEDGLRDIGADAASRGDQAFMVLFDQRFVDSGIFAVQAFRKSKGGQLYEVLIAFFVFCQ